MGTQQKAEQLKILEMKRYYKEENGVRVWASNILKVDGLQIFNPSEKQLLDTENFSICPYTKLKCDVLRGR